MANFKLEPNEKKQDWPKTYKGEAKKNSDF